MPNLGLTVYLWSVDAQNLFLSSCLAPIIEQLREEGLVSRCWFERMDIRGPHVFAPIRVSAAAMSEASRRISERVSAHLTENPCPLSMTPAEIKLRHDCCRGKLQSAADLLPGFAENNTFCIVPHDERDYPFYLSLGLDYEEELWLLLTELTLWSIGQLSGPDGIRQAKAVRWCAAFDEAVGTSMSEPDRYWRYHATTLLPDLSECLASGEDRVFSQLPMSFSERDSEVFSNAWGELTDSWCPSSHIHRIVQIVLSASGLTEQERFGLLREIIHVGLKQLCLKVAFHCPLVLFAWSRNRGREDMALTPAF